MKITRFWQQTSNKFMKCSTEFSNCGTFHNLEQSKIFKLLDLPKDDREEFITTSHKINGQTKNVDDMTRTARQK